MSVHDKKGKQLYKNSFVTNHTVNLSTIHQIASLGRQRWKIENEAFNMLKTKGYHLEHTFGHGKKNLANTLATLNLIAFLVHQLTALLEPLYALAKNCFGAQARFFQALSTLLAIQVYPSWKELFLFIAQAFQIHKKLN